MTSPQKSHTNPFFPEIDLSTVGYFGAIPSDIRNLISGYDNKKILLDEFIDHLLTTYFPTYGYDLELLNFDVAQNRIKKIIELCLFEEIYGTTTIEEIKGHIINRIGNDHKSTFERLCALIDEWDFDNLVEEIDIFFTPNIDMKREGEFYEFLYSDVSTFVTKLIWSMGIVQIKNLDDEMMLFEYTTVEKIQRSRFGKYKPKRSG